MKWSKTALLVLGVIAAVLVAGPAAAGKKSGSLPATGNTIGGPAQALLRSSGIFLWEIKGGASRDICVTVANGGRFNVFAFLDVGNMTVRPGETRTLCGAGESRVQALCAAEAEAAGAPCPIQWRVDLM